MSLTQLVTDMVDGRDCDTTVDDLMPECKGYTRDQVIQALQNAKHLNRIELVRRGEPLGRRGSTPSVYGPRQLEPIRKVDTTTWKRPVSFVFNLGSINT